MTEQPEKKVPIESERGTVAREAAYWDAVAARKSDLPDVGPLLQAAPFRAMVAWLGDLAGRRVLDICCGSGASTVALALSGAAEVVGLDVSEASLEIGRRLASHHGCAARVRFVRQPVETWHAPWSDSFDAIFGMYALHHLELPSALPNLARYLRPGSRAVFLETSALNPLLRWSRKHLAGRYGIARYGSIDEHPLTAQDLRHIGEVVGEVHIQTKEVYFFFRLFDRQVLRYRSRVLSATCRALDHILGPIWPTGSYHLILACTKQGQ